MTAEPPKHRAARTATDAEKAAVTSVLDRLRATVTDLDVAVRGYATAAHFRAAPERADDEPA